MAADVVGYSRHMGRDEAGTLARVKDHLAQRLGPALLRNRGRLVKLTGDGALAEFGSAVEALKAAMEFQQAVEQANGAHPEGQRIVFRVGLHLGDIIVDGDDIYGDSVNIAARLEREATPSGIVISGRFTRPLQGAWTPSSWTWKSFTEEHRPRCASLPGYMGRRTKSGAGSDDNVPGAGAVAAPLRPLLDKASLAVSLPEYER
jgi:class 3 adenylate cyclase